MQKQLATLKNGELDEKIGRNSEAIFDKYFSSGGLKIIQGFIIGSSNSGVEVEIFFEWK